MTQYAKVAISLPKEDLEAADALAQELDRPRSWVIAQAVRRLVQEHRAPETLLTLDPSRRVQLGRDAALTPEARVHAAEEILAVGGHPHGAPTRPLRFATYAEFAAWRKARRER